MGWHAEEEATVLFCTLEKKRYNATGMLKKIKNILALNQQGSILMRKVTVGQKIKSEVGFAVNKGSVLMRQVTAGHEIKSK